MRSVSARQEKLSAAVLNAAISTKGLYGLYGSYLMVCGCLQEDAHCAVLQVDSTTNTGFFGVFDGHGGQEVARYSSLRMVRRSDFNRAAWLFVKSQTCT